MLHRLSLQPFLDSSLLVDLIAFCFNLGNTIWEIDRHASAFVVSPPTSPGKEELHGRKGDAGSRKDGG